MPSRACHADFVDRAGLTAATAAASLGRYPDQEVAPEMYVRIARFENAGGDWDERIEEVRKRMSGEVDSPMAQTLDAVERAMMLVDRENGRGAGVIFCESQDDLRHIDQAMNQMSPPPGAGMRSSVEIYEVVVDEAPS